jgi:large subunit ribosomal protein L25
MVYSKKLLLIFRRERGGSFFMSSDTITLAAHKRDVLGKKVRALRAEGKTPAVVHDHGNDSVHISIEEKDLKKVYSQAGKHHPVVLDIDGKKYTTLIKEVTYRPATPFLYHSVFQAIKANETVKAQVPIKLVGEIPAEKASLLVLQNMENVEIEALPKDLMDVIEIDASKLAEAGDKLHVSDIKLPTGVEIKVDPELAIATVEVPRDQIAEADAAAAELAADKAEGETAEGEGEEAEAGAEESAAEGEAAEAPSADESKE